MSEFLHKLAEGLRSREKMMEDHAEHSVFDQPEGDKYQQEYNALMAEIKEFSDKIEKARKAKEDFDEHFEREIEENHQKLSVKVDTWQKTLPN